MKLYKKDNYKDFFVWLLMLTIIFIMRSITIMTTSLPDASCKCKYDGLFSSCNDLFFSSHCSIITLNTLFLIKNYPEHKMVSIIISILGYITTIPLGVQILF